ncbi:hypothetical protein NMG60_11031352 [Bertholletia excelsa]
MGIFAVDLDHGFPVKNYWKIGKLKKASVGLSPKAQFLIIRLSRSWVLNILIRILLVAMVVSSFPLIASRLGGFFSDSMKDTNANFEAEIGSGLMNLDLLPLLLRDLGNEGLLRMGDRSLFVTGGNDGLVYNSQILRDHDVDLISYLDMDRHSTIPDETYDIVFANAFDLTGKFIDRTLKVGGIAIVGDLSATFRKLSNYKTVYLRRFGNGDAVVALRKIGFYQKSSPTTRRLLGVSDKKEALKHLEEVLLEPPGKSHRRHLRKTRYLPDLTGDTLESYPRRVFLDVAPTGSDGAKWFKKNYPTRNKHFEMYKVDMVEEEEAAPTMRMSEWLRRNVREEEYVVMKAEAEVVEEMVKNRVIGLVDELFLECKTDQGQSGKRKRSTMAYWECLALYGGLKDEGIAVHQWWS